MPDPKQLYQLPKKQRNLVLVAVLGLVVLAGVWTALWLQRNSRRIVSQPADSQSVILTQIVIGALTHPDEARRDNPALQEKTTYDTNDRIVLRVTTAPDIVLPIEMGARLLTAEGQIVELDPPSVKLNPGTSSFCCWHITQEGEYTLQLFRPERTISTIPLIVRKAIDAGQIPIFR